MLERCPFHSPVTDRKPGVSPSLSLARPGSDTCLPYPGPNFTGIAARAAHMLSAPAALPLVNDSDDSRPGSAAAGGSTVRTSVAAAGVAVAVGATTHPEATPADRSPDIARTAARAAGEVYIEVTGVADKAAASASSATEGAEAPGKQQPSRPALQTRHSAAHGKAPPARSSRAASVASGRTRMVAGRAAKQQPRTRVAGETLACSSAQASAGLQPRVF